jgi:molybdopterin-guanine dinucleotide biosynthesis protein A
MKVTGIILAGGKSSRMGTEKGLIEIHGRPMTRIIIDLLRPLCNTIFISTSNPLYSSFGYPLIPDLHKDKGPISGLYSALSASPNHINLFLPCDVPYMRQEILELLLITANSNPEKCIIPYTDYPEPLIAVYPKSTLPVLNQLIMDGETRIKEIFNHLPTLFISMKEAGINYHAFKNINTPDDLKI